MMDLQAPFEGNAIPAGIDRSIAVYKYCVQGSLGDEPVSYPITFQDGLGTPAKENSAVIGGSAITPELSDGSLRAPAAILEDCGDGEDNDDDG
ncbi:MAG: hypothetical protein AAF488_13745, partial [Planctomycetota bacterium]